MVKITIYEHSQIDFIIWEWKERLPPNAIEFKTIEVRESVLSLLIDNKHNNQDLLKKIMENSSLYDIIIHNENNI